MAISFVSEATGSSSPNAQTSVTISTPQVDDLILVAFAVGDTSASDTDISLTGYTEVADLFSGGDTNDTDLWVGYKYSNGSETTVGPFTAIGGTNAANAAAVMVFRGVATAAEGGPFDTAANTATGIDTSDANPPSHNHSGAAGTWTVIAGATGHTGGGTASYALPANYDGTAILSHNDTIDVLIAMGYNDTPADPEDPGVMVATNIGTTANNSWCAVTMSLKPAPAVERVPYYQPMRQLLAH